MQFIAVMEFSAAITLVISVTRSFRNLINIKFWKIKFYLQYP